MRLDRIEISGVKGSNLSQNLKPINVYVGDNRTGKSTVMQAVQLAMFGVASDIGKRSAGSLVDQGSCSATAYSGKASFRCRITKGKTVSQSHEASENIEFPVPTTVADLWSLTGEELWVLLAPGGIEFNTSLEPIRSFIDTLERYPISSPSVESLRYLAGTVSSDPYNSLTKMVSCAKTAEEFIKEGRQLASVTPRQFKIEMSQAAAQEELTAIDSQIMASAKAESERSKRETVRKSCAESIDAATARLADIQSDLQTLRGTLASHRLITQQLADFPPNASWVDPSTAAGLLAGCRDLQDRILGHRMYQKSPKESQAKIDSSLQTFIREMESVFSEICSVGETDSRLGAATDLATELKTLPKSILCDDARARLVETRKSAEAKMEVQIAGLEKYRQSQNELITQLESQRDAAQDVLPESLTPEQLETLSDRKAYLTWQLSEIEEQAKFINNSLVAAKKIEEADRALEAIDGLIREVNEMRQSLIEAQIDQSVNHANCFLSRLGMPKVVLETVAGKRPSVQVRTADGREYVALSGAERLLYGIALLIAFQFRRKVKLPLLFIEAGELDANMFQVAIQAVADLLTDGNAFFAHWYTPAIEEMYLDRVSVNVMKNS